MFRFILMKGVIGWGIPTALLFVVLQYLLHQDTAPQHMLRAFIVFALGGIPYGAFLWRSKGKAPTKKTMLYWVAIAVCLAIFFVLISLHAT